MSEELKKQHWPSESSNHLKAEISPRPWSYGIQSGEDRSDTEWGGNGFWDAEGRMILGSMQGLDSDWTEPNAEDVKLILTAVNGSEERQRAAYGGHLGVCRADGTGCVYGCEAKK